MFKFSMSRNYLEKDLILQFIQKLKWDQKVPLIIEKLFCWKIKNQIPARNNVEI